MGLGAINMADVENTEPDLEITIEDPESVEIGVDGKPILRIEKSEDEEGFDDNLAEYISDSQLTEIASNIIGDVEDDMEARR